MCACVLDDVMRNISFSHSAMCLCASLATVRENTAINGVVTSLVVGWLVGWSLVCHVRDVANCVP